MGYHVNEAYFAKTYGHWSLEHQKILRPVMSNTSRHKFSNTVIAKLIGESNAKRLVQVALAVIEENGWNCHRLCDVESDIKKRINFVLNHPTALNGIVKITCLDDIYKLMAKKAKRMGVNLRNDELLEFIMKDIWIYWLRKQKGDTEHQEKMEGSRDVDADEEDIEEYLDNMSDTPHVDDGPLTPGPPMSNDNSIWSFGRDEPGPPSLRRSSRIRKLEPDDVEHTLESDGFEIVETRSPRKKQRQAPAKMQLHPKIYQAKTELSSRRRRPTKFIYATHKPKPKSSHTRIGPPPRKNVINISDSLPEEDDDDLEGISPAATEMEQTVVFTPDATPPTTVFTPVSISQAKTFTPTATHLTMPSLITALPYDSNRATSPTLINAQSNDTKSTTAPNLVGENLHYGFLKYHGTYEKDEMELTVQSKDRTSVVHFTRDDFEGVDHGEWFAVICKTVSDEIGVEIYQGVGSYKGKFDLISYTNSGTRSLVRNGRCLRNSLSMARDLGYKTRILWLEEREVVVKTEMD